MFCVLCVCFVCTFMFVCSFMFVCLNVRVCMVHFMRKCLFCFILFPLPFFFFFVPGMAARLFCLFCTFRCFVPHFHLFIRFSLQCIFFARLLCSETPLLANDLDKIRSSGLFVVCARWFFSPFVPFYIFCSISKAACRESSSGFWFCSLVLWPCSLHLFLTTFSKASCLGEVWVFVFFRFCSFVFFCFCSVYLLLSIFTNTYLGNFCVFFFLLLVGFVGLAPFIVCF